MTIKSCITSLTEICAVHKKSDKKYQYKTVNFTNKHSYDSLCYLGL